MELFNAVHNSDIDKVNRMLNLDVNVNHRYSDNYTLLMYASDLIITKLLLDKGADPNLQNRFGYTSLIYDSDFNDSKKVKLLLDRGANPFIKNKKGESALTKAKTNTCKKIISKYIWDRLYQADKTLAKYYSRSIGSGVNGETPCLPKDVWELILLNKRQMELNICTDEYKYVVIYFANMLNIPIKDKLTKNDLCNLISKYLAYGQYDDPKRGEFINRK